MIDNFALITTKSPLVYKMFVRFFDFNKLFTNYKLRLQRSNERILKHETFLRTQCQVNNNNTNTENNVTETNLNNEEFNSTIKKLENVHKYVVQLYKINNNEE